MNTFKNLLLKGLPKYQYDSVLMHRSFKLVGTMTFSIERSPFTYIYFISKIILLKKKEAIFYEINIILDSNIK